MKKQLNILDAKGISNKNFISCCETGSLCLVRWMKHSTLFREFSWSWAIIFFTVYKKVNKKGNNFHWWRVSIWWTFRSIWLAQNNTQSVKYILVGNMIKIRKCGLQSQNSSSFQACHANSDIKLSESQFPYF